MIAAIHGILEQGIQNRYANFVNGGTHAKYPSLPSVSTYAIWTRIRVTNTVSGLVAFSLGTIQLGAGKGIALYTRTGVGGNFLQIVANNGVGSSNLYYPSNHTVVQDAWIDCLILYKDSKFHFFINSPTPYTPAGTFATESFNPYFTMGAVPDNAGALSGGFWGHMDFWRYYTDPGMTLENVYQYTRDNISSTDRRYEFSNNTNDSSPNNQHAIFEQNFTYADA